MGVGGLGSVQGQKSKAWGCVVVIPVYTDGFSGVGVPGVPFPFIRLSFVSFKNLSPPLPSPMFYLVAYFSKSA